MKNVCMNVKDIYYVQWKSSYTWYTIYRSICGCYDRAVRILKDNFIHFRSVFTHLLCGMYGLVILVFAFVFPTSSVLTHTGPAGEEYFLEVCKSFIQLWVVKIWLLGHTMHWNIPEAKNQSENLVVVTLFLWHQVHTDEI